MMMPEIKAVFFDLDGTLLDRNASLLKFIDDQYERYKTEIGFNNKQYFMARFVELDARGYVWKDQVYRQLLQEMKITRVSWEDLLEDYLEHFKYSCVPFPNLIEVLQKLKGLNLEIGLISNGRGYFQMENLKALGIYQYFDSVLISENEGLRKPDIRIFQKGLNNLSVSSENSIFVGDHPDNDVKAARDAGMQTVWKRDEFWNEAEADFIIDNLAELLYIILSERNGRK
jgi:putative hydrolase of the HAD superfamily